VARALFVVGVEFILQLRESPIESERQEIVVGISGPDKPRETVWGGQCQTCLSLPTLIFLWRFNNKQFSTL
jgi:hypothetical protein